MVEAPSAVGFDAKVTMEKSPGEEVREAAMPPAGEEESPEPRGTERSEPCAETVSSQQQAEIDTEREVVDAEQKAEREVAEEREEEMCTVEAPALVLEIKLPSNDDIAGDAEHASEILAEEVAGEAFGPVNLPRPVSFPEVLGPPGCVPEQPLREAAEAPDDDEEPNGTLASAQHQSPETVRQEAADQVIGPEVAPPGYADEDASDLPASKTQVVDLDVVPDPHEGLVLDLSAQAPDGKKEDIVELDAVDAPKVVDNLADHEDKAAAKAGPSTAETQETATSPRDSSQAKQHAELGDIRDEVQGFLEGDVPAVTEESPPARRVAKPRNGLFATTRADTLEPLAPSAGSSKVAVSSGGDTVQTRTMSETKKVARSPNARAERSKNEAAAAPLPRETTAKDLNVTPRSHSRRRHASPCQTRHHATRQSRSRHRLSSAVKKSRSRQRSPKRPPPRKSRSRDRRMKRQRSPSRQRRRSPSPYKPSSHNHRRSPSWRRAKSCSRASSSSSPPLRGRLRQELSRRSKHDSQPKKHESSKGTSKKEQHRSPPRKSGKAGTARSPSKKPRKNASHRRPSPSLSSVASSSPSRRKVAKRDKSEKAKKGTVKEKKGKAKEAAATTAKTMAAAASQKSKTASRPVLGFEGDRQDVQPARHTPASSSTAKPATIQKATTTIKDPILVGKSSAPDAGVVGKKRKKDKMKDKAEKEKKIKTKGKKKATVAGQLASSPKQKTAASETKAHPRVAVKASSSTAGEKSSAHNTVPKASARVPQPQLRAVTAAASQSSRNVIAIAKVAADTAGRPKPGSLSSTSAASNTAGARQLDHKVIVLDEDEDAQVRKTIVAAKSQPPLAKAQASIASATVVPSAAPAAPAGTAAAENDTLDSYSEYETDASVVEAQEVHKATSSTAALPGSSHAASAAGATQALATAQAMAGSKIQAPDQGKGSSPDTTNQAVKQALTSKLQNTQKQLLQLQLAVKQQQLEKLRSKLKATKGKKPSLPSKAGGHVTARWRPPASKAATWSAPLPVPKSAPAPG
mmetsp:Transcript_54649/g.127800  ORF Transcript_54649/g.127800 Transcript_54649/m.127800 type:complete len:1030 (-) Transcript_54649:52-3141(-)